MLKKPIFLLKALEWVVFIVLLSLLGLIISPKLPFKNLPKTYVVVSGSMEPTIHLGSVVFVKAIDTSLLKKGDIIAFSSPTDVKDTILHRIISINSRDPIEFQTKGDANKSPDDWAVVDVGVKGIYLFSIPLLGYLGAFIQKPLGFGLLIVFPAVVFIISQILNIKKTISEEIEKGVARRFKEQTRVNKIILFALISNGVIALATNHFVRAALSDSIDVSGINISIKDFVPPPVPNLLSPPENSFHQSEGLIFDWSDVGDFQNMSHPVNYQFQTSSDNEFSLITLSQEHLTDSSFSFFPFPEGIYYWRVRACDALDNCSNWTLSQKITLDNSPPISSFQGVNSPFQNTTALALNYSASDNVDYVNLCYSYNSTAWTCPDSWQYQSRNSTFSLSAPQGDGMYYFATIAHDLAGNVEVKDFDLPINPFNSDYLYLFIDSQPPTTNIDGSTLSQNLWSGPNLLSDTFPQELLLDSATPQSSAWKIFSLPQNSLSQLSFKFNFTSLDFGPQNQFSAQIQDASSSDIIEHLLSYGNNSLSPVFNSGWQYLIHPLYDYAGKTIKLWFGVTQANDSPLSNNWVYLNDIQISPLEVRVGETSSVDYLATDMGVGTLTTPAPYPLAHGNNQVGYSSVDMLENIENSHNAGIIVLAPLVLDKIDFASQKIYLYNNTLTTQNTDAIYIENLNGDTQTLTDLSIGPTSSFSFDLTLPLQSSDSLKLFYQNSLQDTTTFSSVFTQWQRFPHGVGTWISNDTGVSMNLVSASPNKITLTLNHVASTLTYEILYQSQGQVKGILGHISQNDLIDGKTDRDLYLGSCSANACYPDPIDIGSTLSATITDIDNVMLTQTLSF